MRITKKELSKWIVIEGEMLQEGWVCNAYSYENGTENDQVEDGIMLRKWDDNDWHEPTQEYIKNNVETN